MIGKKNMIESYDVGSIPFIGNSNKFLEGSLSYRSNNASQNANSAEYFEKKVIETFIDKINAGIDVPNYPQFRDMNKMFLESIEGLEKNKMGYIELGKLSIPKEKSLIKEIAVIKTNSEKISKKIGHPFKVKISITGPYTLSGLFLYKNSETFIKLGEIILSIVENSIFRGKYGQVDIISLDEPTFGFLDDPLLDYGSDGNENLRKSWETIFQKAKSKGVKTCIHLHNTVNGLFWGLKSLNIVESHVEDSLYRSEKTKKLLESNDKFLKASITTSIFDNLIKNHIVANESNENSEFSIIEKIAEAWKNIQSKKLDPAIFLEKTELIQKRLTNIIDLFGSERVLYAGPECGLKSFPTYECALKCLTITADVVRNITNTIN